MDEDPEKYEAAEDFATKLILALATSITLALTLLVLWQLFR